MGLRLRAASGTCRGSCRCTPCAQTLTTVWPKRIRHLASSASRSGFIAGRFWTRRLRWRVEQAPTRLTSRAVKGASAVHAPDVSAKGAAMAKGAATDPVAVAVEIEGNVHKKQ